MKQTWMILMAATGLAVSLWAQEGISEAPLPLLPQPLKLERGAGVFELDPPPRIVVDASDPEARQAGEMLAVQLKARTGLDFQTGEADGKRAIVLTRKEANPALGLEGYALTVKPEGVVISAPHGAGLFYGTQTLLQLLPTAKSVADPRSRWRQIPAVPAVRIEDQPRFAWRGLMLDCSRTFQSLDYLRRTIDRMAAYKMNVLHLHLTDDQGWRIEIKKHPDLTGKAARYDASCKQSPSVEGFYTQSEIRELILYAQQRHVEVIPEIEMPAHSMEVFVCRPDLTCPLPFVDKILTFDAMLPLCLQDWSRYSSFCAGNPGSYQFLQEVLAEIVDLFPSKYVHVGGDEMHFERWQRCPKCQTLMKAQGLKDEHELQSYFMRQVENFLAARGKQPVSWADEPGIASEVVMWWRAGDTKWINAIDEGHNVVMCPDNYCYFDYSYDRINEAKAYSFDPTARLTPTQVKHVLGLQACFWSHLDRKPELVDWQLFPRLLSLAERGWSPAEVRDWPAFKVRLNAQQPQLRAMGIHYHREPFARWTPPQVSETYKPPVWDAASERGGTYKPLAWDVSKVLEGPGRYRVTFRYTRGASRLGLESVELLADGVVVSADRHRGVTGASHQDNTYLVELKQQAPATKYELRAAVRSEGGTDSYGDVTIEKCQP